MFEEIYQCFFGTATCQSSLSCGIPDCMLWALTIIILIIVIIFGKNLVID